MSTLACGAHDECTFARGTSARFCAGLLTVASFDARLLVRSIRCYVFLSLKREMSVHSKTHLSYTDFKSHKAARTVAKSLNRKRDGSAKLGFFASVGDYELVELPHPRPWEGRVWLVSRAFLHLKNK